MRVSIEGLPDREAEETRDHFASVIASAAERMNLRSKLSMAHFRFGGNSENSPPFDAQSGRVESHGRPEREVRKVKSEDEEIQLDGLVALPSTTAKNIRLRGHCQDAIDGAIARFAAREQVYETWGIAEIDRTPRLALNFAGPPGTGKTMAAHYLAHRLDKRIIEVSYADVVSKYFGEAAKNLSRLFSFAASMDAVLFIDEAETLLSRRGESSSGGADHATNSMRSQLLTLLDRTPILSVFATNLISNYDPAFLSRLVTVQFPMPDFDLRRDIWSAHLPNRLPLEMSVTADHLANRFSALNGRQIWRIVVEAAHYAAVRGAAALDIGDFDWAANFVLATEGAGDPASSALMGSEKTAL